MNCGDLHFGLFDVLANNLKGCYRKGLLVACRDNLTIK